MKIRQDFISNSSSCSFIIKDLTKEDLDHLSKPEYKSILKKYASDVITPANEDMKYPSLDSFCDMDFVLVGDSIRIYIGEDSDFGFYDDPTYELYNIYNKLNDGYGKLSIAPDTDAHVTIGC